MSPPEEADLGGEAPCWAHQIDDDGTLGGEPGPEPDAGDAVVADLGAVGTEGRNGAVWSLPHGGDLDANLVRLHGGSGIGAHVNDEVDVLVFVQSGRGQLVVDGVAHALHDDTLALVPAGVERSITAGSTGLTYLSVHRRRGPLVPGPMPRPSDGR